MTSEAQTIELDKPAHQYIGSLVGNPVHPRSFETDGTGGLAFILVQIYRSGLSHHPYFPGAHSGLLGSKDHETLQQPANILLAFLSNRCGRAHRDQRLVHQT